jgi:5'-nucleotidase
MRFQFRRAAFAFVFSLVVVCAARADDFKLKIIALNDFHGNLQSPGKFRANAQSPLIPAGGVDFLAGYVEHLKSQNPYNVVVAAGDLIGASPLVSALFHDEDTIETMNRLGLELTSVGNHEFDKGKQELLRMQHGGCSTQDQNTCEGSVVGTAAPFEGAKFEYLAANVVDTSTGKTLFPAYAVKTYDGVKVAFIGLTLKDTPTIVTPTGVAGLRFADEAGTINAIVSRLRKQGIKIFVVLIHQGGEQTTKGTIDINVCEGGLNGYPIQSIVGKLDNAVALVVSGHTHAAYVCQLPNSVGRKIFVTSAESYGRLITDIDMTIDTKTKDVKSVTAHNLVVDRTGASGIVPDTALKTIVDKYAALAAPIANRQVGSIAADITRANDTAGENPLGDLIADSQLEATSAVDSGGAVVAFMNDGGIRANLPFASGMAGVQQGEVTYGELFTIQPFGNSLVTMNLTGAQIKTLLEEQFEGCALDLPTGDSPPPHDRFLQVSEGFTYTWTSTSAECNKVDPRSIKINGVVIAPTAKYRVTVNSFLADGGDQMYVLKKGTDRLGGPLDLDAMTAYFAKHGSVAPAQPDRIGVKP